MRQWLSFQEHSRRGNAPSHPDRRATCLFEGISDEVDREAENTTERHLGDAVEFKAVSARLRHSAHLIGDEIDRRHDANRLHLDC